MSRKMLPQHTRRLADDLYHPAYDHRIQKKNPHSFITFNSLHSLFVKALVFGELGLGITQVASLFVYLRGVLKRRAEG